MRVGAAGSRGARACAVHGVRRRAERFAGEHDSEEREEGEREGGEKEKGKRKGKGEREKERVAAGFTAATAAGRARAPVGDAQRVARNEGKKRMGWRLNSGVGTAKISGKEFEGFGAWTEKRFRDDLSLRMKRNFENYFYRVIYLGKFFGTLQHVTASNDLGKDKFALANMPILLQDFCNFTPV